MEEADMEISRRVVETAREWIGTPYVHQASVKGAGCDCLGLLRGVWRELMGDEPESAPPYSEDWAEAQAEETMYAAFKRHFDEVDTATLIPGDVALFRMATRGPAKHCGIVGCANASLLERDALTLIHSRANTRVTEEPLTAAWRRKLAFGFRL
jgi:NlpC/P60 family putative phage cell wall peptidase